MLVSEFKAKVTDSELTDWYAYFEIKHKREKEALKKAEQEAKQKRR